MASQVFQKCEITCLWEVLELAALVDERLAISEGVYFDAILLLSFNNVYHSVVFFFGIQGRLLDRLKLGRGTTL